MFATTAIYRIGRCVSYRLLRVTITSVYPRRLTVLSSLVTHIGVIIYVLLYMMDEVVW